MPTTFLGKTQRRSFLGDMLGGMQASLPYYQLLQNRSQTEQLREKQIADRFLLAWKNTDEAGREAMMANKEQFNNMLKLVEEVYPGTIGTFQKPGKPSWTLQQASAISGYPIPAALQGKARPYRAPIMPAQKREGFTVAKGATRYEPRVGGGFDIIEGYREPGKELSPTEQAYQAVWQKYQSGEELDSIEQNILKYHPTELMPKQVIIKQIWQKYQSGEALTDIERTLLTTTTPKETPIMDLIKQKIWQKKQGGQELDEIEIAILSGIRPTVEKPKERAFADVWAKHTRGETLSDIERGIIGAELEKKTVLTPEQKAFKDAWAKSQEGGVLSDPEKARLGIYKAPTELTPQQSTYEQIWDKKERGEKLEDLEIQILGGTIEKKKELSPQEQAFKDSWEKYKTSGVDRLSNIDKAQLGLQPEKELTPKQLAYQKAYEKYMSGRNLTKLDFFILGIPLKEAEELKGKELIVDRIARKYLKGQTLSDEEWQIIGVTPKAEPGAKDQVIEWSFDRVKQALEAGQRPDPGDLQVIGAYVKGAPEENVTAKIKSWAFDRMTEAMARGEAIQPELWKIIGGYVTPTKPARPEFRVIGNDLWAVNPVTLEKRKVITGQPDKLKLVKEAEVAALNFMRGKYYKGELQILEEEQAGWDKEFRIQFHKELLNRGFGDEEARKIIAPSPLSLGAGLNIYSPPKKALTPDERRIYDLALREKDRKKIKNVQKNLVKWGLYSGSITGEYDEATRRALYYAVQRGLVGEVSK